MPEYLNLLRDVSIASIYILFAEVIIFLFFKGKIKDKTLQLFAYIWLPLAVVTQSLMTSFRNYWHLPNLPVMNIYLILELILMILIGLKIREEVKGVKINYKIWTFLILLGILIHLTDNLNSLHVSAMLYTAILFFNISISSIELENIENILKNPYLLINFGIFSKAVGYSYFTIYQIDYKFPLGIYSLLNILGQLFFFLSIFSYYKYRANLNK